MGTGNVNFDVLVDLSTSEDREIRIFNVMNLWRSLLRVFSPELPRTQSHDSDMGTVGPNGSPGWKTNKTTPWLTHPIEVICLLLVITKSDYVEALNHFSPKRVWDRFYRHCGWQFFSHPTAVTVHPDPLTLIGEDQYSIVPRQRRLMYNENAIRDFIQYVYWCEIFRDPKIDYYPIERMKSIPDIVQRLIEKQSKTFLVDDIVHEHRLMARVRRITWNLDYWFNGPQGLTWYIFARHGDTNLSIFGWVYNDKNQQQQQQQNHAVRPEFVDWLKRSISTKVQHTDQKTLFVYYNMNPLSVCIRASQADLGQVGALALADLRRGPGHRLGGDLDLLVVLEDQAGRLLEG